MVVGSTVSVAPLKSDGLPSGQVFQTQTENDRGDFTVQVEGADVVRIEAAGFYFNEVTGELSTAPITLRAFYAATNAAEQTAYVNIFTHLTYERALSLYKGGAAPDAAIAQAEAELKALLPLPEGAAEEGSSLSVTSSAYLFALSAVLVQAAVTTAGDEGSVDGELQELINDISAALVDGADTSAEVGALDDATAALDVELVMAQMAARFVDIGSTTNVPDLDTVIDSDGDGMVNAGDSCPWLDMSPEEAATTGVCFVSADYVGASTSGYWRPYVLDWDGDGNLDIAVADEIVTVYPGDGIGRCNGPGRCGLV